MNSKTTAHVKPDDPVEVWDLYADDPGKSPTWCLGLGAEHDGGRAVVFFPSAEKAREVAALILDTTPGPDHDERPEPLSIGSLCHEPVWPDDDHHDDPDHGVEHVGCLPPLDPFPEAYDVAGDR